MPGELFVRRADRHQKDSAAAGEGLERFVRAGVTIDRPDLARRYWGAGDPSVALEESLADDGEDVGHRGAESNVSAGAPGSTCESRNQR